MRGMAWRLLERVPTQKIRLDLGDQLPDEACNTAAGEELPNAGYPDEIDHVDGSEWTGRCG